MHGTALVAIGGNALLRAGEPPSVVGQRAHLTEICGVLAQLAAGGWRLIVTHGNGPQVGAALRRSELGAADAYPLSLDMCVAATQGEIGVLLEQGLRDALTARSIHREVATLSTLVVVAPDDPAFVRPSKPVGVFYTEADARARRAAGWTLVAQPHGYRRLVASPEPVAIVEEEPIRALSDAGVIVIALGGGGVPVVEREGRLLGVEAVIDKDLSSALLAIHLGVEVLAMVTDVDRVYEGFATPDARGLGEVAPDELRVLAAAGHFPHGTMGPKVEAALRFITAGGPQSIVTSPDRLIATFEGHDAGTRVVAVARDGGPRRGTVSAHPIERSER